MKDFLLKDGISNGSASIGSHTASVTCGCISAPDPICGVFPSRLIRLQRTFVAARLNAGGMWRVRATLSIRNDSDLQASMGPDIGAVPCLGGFTYPSFVSICCVRNTVPRPTSYSTLWPARAIPTEGRLISLELEETHARVARANLARAGVSDRTEVRVGPALETLPRLQKELDQPFCFSFIDADKANIPHYFDWAVKLAARLADPGR